MGRDGLRVPGHRGTARRRGRCELGAGSRPGVQLGHRVAGGMRLMATPEVTREAVRSFDLALDTVRELNQTLHDADPAGGRVIVRNPGGRHAIAVGLDAPFEVEIEGHVGYYCAGMNKLATVRVRGNCGVGVAENMMSGSVIVEGSGSQSGGASARGRLLVIHGDASARGGRSLQVADIGVRGFGAKRPMPHFDDLLFLGASVSRYPLEGYRERCATDVVIGTRFAREPVRLDIPITIAGMSFGALSGPAKEALGRGATEVGTCTTTGDGGMTPEERGHSKLLVYQLLPSRYGMNPDDLRKADAIEVVVGQGAKPGGGGMLLGHKISDRVAAMRNLPKGIDQRSACRHPDWTGPDDLEIKIV